MSGQGGSASGAKRTYRTEAEKLAEGDATRGDALLKLGVRRKPTDHYGVMVSSDTRSVPNKRKADADGGDSGRGSGTKGRRNGAKDKEPADGAKGKERADDDPMEDDQTQSPTKVTSTAWDGTPLNYAAILQCNDINCAVGTHVIFRLLILASIGQPPPDAIKKIDEADSMPPYQQNVVYITKVLEQGCDFTLEEIKDMHPGVTWALMWTITGCNGLGELVEQMPMKMMQKLYHMATDALDYINTSLDENAAFFWSALNLSVSDKYPRAKALIEQQNSVKANKSLDIIVAGLQFIRDDYISRGGNATAIDSVFGHLGSKDPFSFGHVENGQFLATLFIALVLGLKTETQLIMSKEHMPAPVSTNLASEPDCEALSKFILDQESVSWLQVLAQTPAHVPEAIRKYVVAHIMNLDVRTSIIAWMTRVAFGTMAEATAWHFMPKSQSKSDKSQEQTTIFWVRACNMQFSVPEHQRRSIMLVKDQVDEQLSEGPPNTTRLFNNTLRMSTGESCMICSDLSPTQDVADENSEPQLAAMRLEDGTYRAVPYCVGLQIASQAGVTPLVINTADPCGFAYALEDMMLHAGTHLRMKCDGTLFTFSSKKPILGAASIYNALCLWQPECMNNAVGRRVLTPDDSPHMLWFEHYGSQWPYVQTALKASEQPLKQPSTEEMRELFVWDKHSCVLPEADALTHFTAIVNPTAAPQDVWKGLGMMLINGGLPCSPGNNQRLSFNATHNAQSLIRTHSTHLHSFEADKELGKLWALYSVHQVFVNGGPAQANNSFCQNERNKALYRLVEAFGLEGVELPPRPRADMTPAQIKKMADQSGST